MHPTTLALLFAADRAEHLLAAGDGILNRLERGELVISDRYLFSSLAYQSLDCDFEYVRALNAEFPLPRDVVFVDTPVRESQRRLGGRARPGALRRRGHPGPHPGQTTAGASSCTATPACGCTSWTAPCSPAEHLREVLENHRIRADALIVGKSSALCAVAALAFSCCFLLAPAPGARAYRVLYAEQYYKLYHQHFYQYPDDTMENIHYLEQALKADFANPLYALARIADRQEWAQYRTLFKMHANLKLTELYLTLGSKYDKMTAYFYNAPWKRQNLDSLEQAESAYRLALGYWRESLRWAAGIPRLRYNLEEIQRWEDEWKRVVTGDLDYREIIDGHLRRLARVRAEFQAMDRTPTDTEPRSQDQHRVAVGEEAVALAHRLPVGPQDRLAAGEGGNQHQQRGARGVEVGQQLAHHPEAVAGPDVQRGLPLPGAHLPFRPGGLQGAHRGRAHRQHAAGPRPAPG